jgi:hypothetical protein
MMLVAKMFSGLFYRLGNFCSPLFEVFAGLGNLILPVFVPEPCLVPWDFYDWANDNFPSPCGDLNAFTDFKWDLPSDLFRNCYLILISHFDRCSHDSMPLGMTVLLL